MGLVRGIEQLPIWQDSHEPPSMEVLFCQGEGQASDNAPGKDQHLEGVQVIDCRPLDGDLHDDGWFEQSDALDPPEVGHLPSA